MISCTYAWDRIERAWIHGRKSIRTKAAGNRFPAHCAVDQCLESRRCMSKSERWSCTSTWSRCRDPPPMTKGGARFQSACLLCLIRRWVTPATRDKGWVLLPVRLSTLTNMSSGNLLPYCIAFMLSGILLLHRRLQAHNVYINIAAM